MKKIHYNTGSIDNRYINDEYVKNQIIEKIENARTSKELFENKMLEFKTDEKSNQILWELTEDLHHRNDEKSVKLVKEYLIID